MIFISMISCGLSSTVAAAVINSKICSLMPLDEKKQEPVIRSAQSVSEAYTRRPNVKLVQGVVAMVAQENRPFLVEDVNKDRRHTKPGNYPPRRTLLSALSSPFSEWESHWSG